MNKRKNTNKESIKNAINQALAQPYSSFGPLIQSTRKKAGITSAAYSKAAEIHTNSQSNYETSKRDPGIDYLIHFCSTVGVSFWQMMYRRVELSDAPEFHKRHIMQELAPFYPHLVNNASNSPAIEQHDLSTTKPQNKAVIDTFYQLLAPLMDKPHIKIFSQNDNSMAPTLNTGDNLLVDTSQTTLSNNDIFIINWQQTEEARRVQCQANGDILLIKDNSDVKTAILDKSNEFKVLGKLITSIKKFDVGKKE